MFGLPIRPLGALHEQPRVQVLGRIFDGGRLDDVVVSIPCDDFAPEAHACCLLNSQLLERQVKLECWLPEKNVCGRVGGAPGSGKLGGGGRGMERSMQLGADYSLSTLCKEHSCRPRTAVFGPPCALTS